MHVAAVAALAALFAAGSATPTPAEQNEIKDLESELTKVQIKGNYIAATKIARKLYAAQRKISGDDAMITQRRKEVLAAMLNGVGEYTEALSMYQELLKAAEKEKGPESREALMALMPLAGVYWLQNRFDEGEPLQRRMLSLTKKLDGERSLAYATQLSQYGGFLNQRNEFAAAQQVYEEVLRLQEALAAKKNDYSLYGPVGTLAHLYWQTKQWPKAIALYDRLIAIVEGAKEAPPMTRAGTLYMVSGVYYWGGRLDLAAPFTKRAIESYQKEIAQLEKTSPDDGQIPMLYDQLGFIYQRENDLANAEKAMSRAIEIDRKKRGFSGREPNLADVKRAQGKPREALALLERAQAGMPKSSPVTAVAFNTRRADILRDLGEYGRAQALLDEYRATIEKTYGRRHPLYGLALQSLAYLHMASGKTAQAEQALTESLDSAERELGLALKTGTESDHVTTFNNHAYQLDVAINFQRFHAPTRPSAARLALTTLLRRKGRVLDASAGALATIRAKLSPEDRKLLDQLAGARAQLAKMTVAGPAAGSEGTYAKDLAALEDKVLKLELEVGRKSAAYRLVSQPIELAAVQKAIPKDARLVELVNFDSYDPKSYTSAKQRHYAAYVLGPKGDPVLVDLGPADAIDQAVTQFRKAVADPDNDRAVDLGRALYDLTMGKVVPKLGGATNILIAPDGSLNLVPFSALADETKSFLIKRFTFTYLTSGRDLLRLGVRSKAQGGGVVFAEPNFDSAGPAAPPAAPGEPGTRGSRSVDLATMNWPPLPGTGQEADQVAKAMRGLAVFRGADASENRLKTVHGPQILHLATHGFFLPDEPRAPHGGGGASAPGEAQENPLLRSGLALAGANKLSSGIEDGILTAMEASGLDLWGTKLVVLSACETGVGKVTNGDGVYGLRRALVIAGAESLVMTLWQVDDAATRDLMTGYYGKLVAGKPRSSALRDIQLSIQARPKYAHPYYWASFVPAGADDPIKE